MNLTDFFKRMFGYTNKRFLLFCFLIFISILYLFFYPLRLSPDSTNYIATAEYLTAGNGFYYNTNWPSLDMSLSLERYTEYPPLFPVIIAVWGAVVGYTGFSIKCFYLLNILLLNYSVFLLLRSFNVNLFFLLLAFCLINFNGSSNVVYEYFWSEVIFLALAIFSIHVIMKRKTFGFVLAIPFLTKTMGVLLFFHELIFKNKIKLRFKIFLSGAFGLILGSLWFLYNYLQVGNTTRSHFSGNVLGKFDADFLLNKIGIPFHWLVTGWINNPFPENGGFNIALSALLSLYLIYLFIQGVLRNKTRRSFGYLVLVTLNLFFGMIVLSIVANFNDLDGRLLFPFCVMFILSTIVFIHRLGKYRNFFGVLFFLLLIKVDVFTKENVNEYSKFERISLFAQENVPNLNDRKMIVSDYEFRHQMFFMKPHRIVWDQKFFDSCEGYSKLINYNPMYIFSKNSSMLKSIIQCSKDFEMISYDGFDILFEPLKKN